MSHPLIRAGALSVIALLGAEARADVCPNGAPLNLLVRCLNAQLTAAVETIDALEAEVEALSSEGGIAGLSDYLSVDAATNTVVFEGANVVVRSGVGSTSGAVNGLGNLIVGYSASDGAESRTGSHNLIVGDYHDWTSYGGVAFGYGHEVSGLYASVLGGVNNTASGESSVVSAGYNNHASALHAVVSGGNDSNASGEGAVVSGGDSNIASGWRSAVLGGYLNEAAGAFSSVVGGDNNAAVTDYAVAGVSGGGIAGLSDYLSVDESTDSVVFTGANVFVQSGSGDTNGAINGLGNLVVGYNEADGDESRAGSHNLIVGEYHDWTSYGGVVFGYENTVTGAYSTVSGGLLNTVSGNFAAVSGGSQGEASGSYAVISGGYSNTSSGAYTVVSGGTNNTAEGSTAAVSGGDSNTATGSSAVVSGGKDNAASGSYNVILGGQSNTTSPSYAYATILGGESAYIYGNHSVNGDSSYALPDELSDLMLFLSVDTSAQEVTLEGVNLHIQSGSGDTDADVNGLGNLIVGYDGSSGDTKSGSHNLVVGTDHSYTSYAGAVFGFDNTISAAYATVTGGYSNTTSSDLDVLP